MTVPARVVAAPPSLPATAVAARAYRGPVPFRRRRRHRRPPLPAGLASVTLRRLGRPVGDAGFAVVDVETTGLVPGTDRVLEIAVVRTDAHGTVLDEWSSLVDPGRDPGASDVHGITLADLQGAATFAEIAPELASRLHGRILVAHNLAFDAAFLDAEQRPSLRGATGGLCTIQLSQAVLHRPAGGWSLGALCNEVGVPLDDAHRALADARATAGLLEALLTEVPARPGPFSRRLVSN
jgi:DNA polymerase-3 subunit epsilon